MNRLIVLVSFVIALVFPGLLVAQDIPCAEYIHDEPRFTACYQQYVMSPELFAENTHKAMPRIPIELAPAIVGAAAGQVTPHGALDIVDMTFQFIAGMPSFADRLSFRPPALNGLWTFRYNPYGESYSYRNDPGMLGLGGVDTLLLGNPSKQWGRSLSIGGDFGIVRGLPTGHVKLEEGLTIFKGKDWRHEVSLNAGGDYFLFSQQGSVSFYDGPRPKMHGPGWHGGGSLAFNLGGLCDGGDCYLSFYGEYGQVWPFQIGETRPLPEWTRQYPVQRLEFMNFGLQIEVGLR